MDISGAKKEPIKKRIRHPRKYCQAWEKDPLFRKWLTRSKQSNLFAYCKVCDAELSLASGKSGLYKHEGSKKHSLSWDSYSEKPAPNVIWAFSEKHLSSSGSRETSDLAVKSEEFNEIYLADTGDNKTSESKVGIKKNRYSQRYLQIWEEDPLFCDWLTSSSKGSHYAYCQTCDIQLSVVSGKSDLLKHSKCKKHKEKCAGLKNVIQTLPLQDIPAKGEPYIPLQEGVIKADKIYLVGGELFGEHYNPPSGVNDQLSENQQKSKRTEHSDFDLGKKSCSRPTVIYPNADIEEKVTGHLQLTRAKITKPAPYWEGTAVVNGQFKELKLSDFIGKYVVFFFYPFDFSLVCPTEILAFNDRLEDFHSINAEVIGCSVDSQFTHLAWTKSSKKEGGLGRLNIPLVSDRTHTISKNYGVYLEDYGVALRALFIIDDKGILRQITINDLPVGRSIDEILRLVRAFQFSDKSGEMCPAGWKPEDSTITSLVEDSKLYVLSQKVGLKC